MDLKWDGLDSSGREQGQMTGSWGTL